MSLARTGTGAWVVCDGEDVRVAVLCVEVAWRVDFWYESNAAISRVRDEVTDIILRVKLPAGRAVAIQCAALGAVF